MRLVVDKEVKPFLMERFGISGKLLSNTLLYRSNSVLARQVRHYILNFVPHILVK